MIPPRAPAPDVVFAFPSARGQRGSFGSHLGVGYLRAALAESGLRSVQYLNPRPGTLAEVARDLVALRPGILGLTVYDANAPLCLALARCVKRENPGIKVVWGGPTVTFGARELLARHDAIDLCVLGESEETGPRAFCRLLEGQAPDDGQLGVAFRRDGRIVCRDAPPLPGARPPEGLDVMTSPYLSGVLPDGRTGVLTGRGCTHRCQYCCFAALGRNQLRLHSVPRVVAELEWMAAQQRRTGRPYVVPVHDDAFTLAPTRAKLLCASIIDRGLRLSLSGMTRADAVDEELLQMMRAAGFVSIAFGLESAVPSVLRAAGKVRPPDWPNHDLAPERLFLERLQRSVRSAKRLGFTVGVSIVLGLPTETAADGEATLRFVRSLPVDYYVHNVLHVFPGTPLWEARARWGLDGPLDSMGLPSTTGYAYDVSRLRPGPKCALAADAERIRDLAAEAMFDCEVSSPATGGVRAVVLDSETLGGATAAWLREVLDVGGTVVQVYAPLKPREREGRLRRDREEMAGHLVPARHYLQVERRRGRGGVIRHVVACAGVDLYRRHRPRLVSFSSADDSSAWYAWLRGAAIPVQVSEISPSLLQSAEFSDLAKKIDAEPDPSPLQRMSLPPRLRSCGRWLKGDPSCRALHRLDVDDRGTVRCCRSADPAGRVGDAKEKLARSFAAMARTVERRRGCRRCGVRDCPRCPFPGVDDETYCRTLKRCGPALGALGWARLYSRLPAIVAAGSSQGP